MTDEVTRGAIVFQSEVSELRKGRGVLGCGAAGGGGGGSGAASRVAISRLDLLFFFFTGASVSN